MGKGKRKRDREDEEPPSGDKKEKKKRKKEKTSVAASDPASAILTAHPSLEVADISEVTGVTAVTSEVREKKKRKKNKSSTETSDHPSSSAVDPAPSANAADKLEKPQKPKSPKDSANANVEAGTSSESKSKKRTKREAVQGEDHHHAASVPENSSHKRKKPKKSIHPDPSDDPDLTEQSRKALTYIHSQITLPETWKFNKARQNWIVRNVWTSKIPEKYVSMVADYLSKVQGRARETLIESCNKVISDPNVDSPVSQEGVNEEGSSENTDPPTPSTIGSEKVQRAGALLQALTNNRRR